jgi:hypothetical protein
MKMKTMQEIKLDFLSDYAKIMMEQLIDDYWEIDAQPSNKVESVRTKAKFMFEHMSKMCNFFNPNGSYIIHNFGDIIQIHFVIGIIGSTTTRHIKINVRKDK